MIRLEPEEILVGTYRVKKSKLGNGTLYVSNLGLRFETHKNGLAIAVPYRWLSSFHAPKKNKIVTVWADPKAGRQQFEYKVDNATEIVQVITRLLAEYNQAIPKAQQNANTKETEK